MLNDSATNSPARKKLRKAGSTTSKHAINGSSMGRFMSPDPRVIITNEYIQIYPAKTGRVAQATIPYRLNS